jgi:prepilin-type N-terminal cleavage/methylation domain-containing protein
MQIHSRRVALAGERAGRAGNDEGMTLVEVMVSLLLVSVLVAGLYAGVVQGLAMNYVAAQRISSFGLCKELLESMRGSAYTSINTNEYGPESVDVARLEIDGTVVRGTRSIEVSTFYYPPRKQVTVNLAWSYVGRSYEESATGTIYYRGRRITGTTGGAVGGSLNLNPNNSPANSFSMSMSDGTQISRDDFIDGFAGIEGEADEIHFQPKGSGTQNTLTLNGQPFDVLNSRSYLIQGNEMSVRLYNTHVNPQGEAVGQWHVEISSPDAMITVQ